jgi:uncharacterized protein YjbJ (UPF0337 family)
VQAAVRNAAENPEWNHRTHKDGLAMNWDRVSGNWDQLKGRVQERWGKLTSDHLDVIAGRRDQLSGRIQEVYGLTKEETERQLRNWERNLSVEYGETDLVADDDEPDSTHLNGRG